MNYEEFKAAVIRELPTRLPPEYRDAEMDVRTVNKTAGSYEALTVIPEGHSTAAAVDLTAMYAEFQRGTSWDSVMRRIADTAVMKPENFNLERIDEYESVKDRIIVKLTGTDNLDNIKDTVPWRLFSDLLVTYHVLVANEPGHIATIMVTNDLLSVYGITQAELEKTAIANTERLYPGSVDSLPNILNGFAPFITEPDPRDESMLVITNREGFYGASVILYPDVLQRGTEYFSGSYYMLPSSIHEVILVPETIVTDRSILSTMVHDINEMIVAPDDRLSDTAYRYDAALEILESFPEYEYRLERESVPFRLSSELDVGDRLVIGTDIFTVVRKGDEGFTLQGVRDPEMTASWSPEDLDSALRMTRDEHLSEGMKETPESIGPQSHSMHM